MDGNFKAEHLWERRPDDQIWLMDGHGYIVTRPDYQAYLKATSHPFVVSSMSICGLGAYSVTFSDHLATIVGQFIRQIQAEGS